jgi:arylsulfatase A-like enzyme
MNRRLFLQTLSGTAMAAATPRERPNVLFIIADDMNDWTSTLGGYAGPVRTPNQDRLASRGVLFSNAYCSSPLCNPSRTSVMLGLRPGTTGIYDNGQWWRPALPDAVTLPEHFRANGYYAAGGGKTFHHTPGFNPPSCWDEYFPQVFDEKPPRFPLNGFGDKSHAQETDWGAVDKTDLEMGDGQMVTWAAKFLAKQHEKPFFLACGLFHPHLPWYVPRKYLDMYPLDRIKLPVLRDNDLDDVPEEGRALAHSMDEDRRRILATGQWRKAVQAYLASITFSDAQMGRLLDALDTSRYRNNTIVIFWSDNGFHLGQKEHWHKSTLWMEATHIPFIIAEPDGVVAGSRCSRTVGLVDIYPTLIELCGLGRKQLDGASLVPLLRNPRAEWKRPAVMTFKRGQHAVCTERYRYIRYSDGTEELYDDELDPHEWTNLASSAKHTQVKKELAGWAAHVDAQPKPSRKAYNFDPDRYTWTRKAGS